MTVPMYLGLAGYFPEHEWTAAVAARFAELVRDARWPVPLTSIDLSGVHKRDDLRKKLSAKIDLAAIVRDAKYRRLGASAFGRAFDGERWVDTKQEASLSVNIGSGTGLDFEAGGTLNVVAAASDATVSLCQELLDTVGAKTAILGIWPAFDMALGDAAATKIVVDTRWVTKEVPSFSDQLLLVNNARRDLGVTYARHPRWARISIQRTWQRSVVKIEFARW